MQSGPTAARLTAVLALDCGHHFRGDGRQRYSRWGHRPPASSRNGYRAQRSSEAGGGLSQYATPLDAATEVWTAQIRAKMMKLLADLAKLMPLTIALDRDKWDVRSLRRGPCLGTARR